MSSCFQATVATSHRATHQCQWKEPTIVTNWAIKTKQNLRGRSSNNERCRDKKGTSVIESPRLAIKAPRVRPSYSTNHLRPMTRSDRLGKLRTSPTASEHQSTSTSTNYIPPPLGIHTYIHNIREYKDEISTAPFILLTRPPFPSRTPPFYTKALRIIRPITPNNIYLRNQRHGSRHHCNRYNGQIHPRKVQPTHADVLAGEDVFPQQTCQGGRERSAEGAVVEPDGHAVHGGPEGAVGNGDPVARVDDLPGLDDAAEEDGGADVGACELCAHMSVGRGGRVEGRRRRGKSEG